MNTESRQALALLAENVKRREDAETARNALTRMLGWQMKPLERMAVRAARDILDEVVSFAEADLEMLRDATDHIGRGRQERPCGCPGGEDDPHAGDCRGFREPTKDDYLSMYAGLDVEDWPDSED